MIPITPAAVGACQPIREGYDYWQIDVALTDEFSPSGYKDGIPHPADKEYVWYKTFFKNPDEERWTAGVNVWTDGSDRFYQSFLFYGDAPKPGRKLNTDYHGIRDVGPAIRMSPDATQDSEVKVGKYPWLRCTITPLNMEFDQTIVSGIANFKTVQFEPAVAVYDTVVNAKDTPMSYSVEVKKSYENSLYTADTDGWHSSGGGSVKYTYEVGIPKTKSHTWELEGHFEYGNHGSLVTTDGGKDVTTISRVITETLEPWTALQISLISDVDENVPGKLDYTIRLSGKVNGRQMDGKFLVDMVNATPNMTLVKMNPESNSMTYVTTADLKASLASNAEIIVYNVPMPDVPVPAAGADVSQMPDVLTASDMKKISRKELDAMKSGQASAL